MFVMINIILPVYVKRNKRIETFEMTFVPNDDVIVPACYLDFQTRYVK